MTIINKNIDTNNNASIGTQTNATPNNINANTGNTGNTSNTSNNKTSNAGNTGRGPNEFTCLVCKKCGHWHFP